MLKEYVKHEVERLKNGSCNMKEFRNSVAGRYLQSKLEEFEAKERAENERAKAKKFVEGFMKD